MKFILLVIAWLAANAAFARSDMARLVAAQTDIANLKINLGAFAVDCGRYPTTKEGFAALINCPTNISGGRWRGPYLLTYVPADPWGNDYIYRYPGIHNTNGFDLYSCGADGASQSGGSDLDDINNWDADSPHGGDYPRLISMKLDRVLNNSPILQAVLPAVILVFQAVSFLGIVRLIAAPFSRSVCQKITRYPTAHLIWFIVSAAGVFFFLSSLIPKIV